MKNEQDLRTTIDFIDILYIYIQVKGHAVRTSYGRDCSGKLTANLISNPNCLLGRMRSSVEYVSVGRHRFVTLPLDRIFFEINVAVCLNSSKNIVEKI